MLFIQPHWDIVITSPYSRPLFVALALTMQDEVAKVIINGAVGSKIQPVQPIITKRLCTGSYILNQMWLVCINIVIL